MLELAITLITAVSVLLGAALIVTSLRLYVRVRIVKFYGLDDWFMLLTMVSRLLCPLSRDEANRTALVRRVLRHVHMGHATG